MLAPPAAPALAPAAAPAASAAAASAACIPRDPDCDLLSYPMALMRSTASSSMPVELAPAAPFVVPPFGLAPPLPLAAPPTAPPTAPARHRLCGSPALLAGFGDREVYSAVFSRVLEAVIDHSTER